MKVLRDTDCTGMIVDRALVPDVMVIPGSSTSLQMVDHTLIDVPLANVYSETPICGHPSITDSCFQSLHILLFIMFK